MSGFRQLGASAGIEDFRSARRNDVAVIDGILEYKANGRDRTGLRALPDDETDVIAGDILGDYFYDFTNEFRYDLTADDGILQWVRTAINATFTNP